MCGLEIPAAASAAPPQGSAAVAATEPGAASAADRGQECTPPGVLRAGGEACPDCGAPRDTGQQVFCEVCGYNFVTRAAGTTPPPSCLAAGAMSGTMSSWSAAQGPPAESAAAGLEAATACAQDAVEGLASAPCPGVPAEEGHQVSGNAARWELILTVDANLYGTPNPDAPLGQPPRKFRLFDRETLVGRAGTEVRVQVPVQGDAGVSRRQALLIQGGDGTLVLRDLNSANGTRVDGVDVLPGVDTLLHDGAAIAIGAWTSITVRAIVTECAS